MEQTLAAGAVGMESTVAPMNAAHNPNQPLLTDELLRRMDVPGPRYTSYPTADRFVEAFGPEHHAQALAQRRMSGAAGMANGLSLYVHVPFCESVCYYCACNKVVTRDHGKVEPYLAALELELDLVARSLGERPVVTQLHFGGGTPTYLDDEQLSRLMVQIRQRFELAPHGEYSIEIDPRTVTHERLAHLGRSA
ncbi:MAG: oxygen-independent coproporphyrinogen oxidase [Pseudomonadota bacterium]